MKSRIMQPRIYALMAVVLVAGSILLVMRRTEPLKNVRFAETIDGLTDTLLLDTLVTGQKYYLTVEDTAQGSMDGVWFWRIKSGQGTAQVFYDLPSIAFTASQPGDHIVQAYKDRREVARDTIHFKEGERIDMAWPEVNEHVAGTSVVFSDRSIGVKHRNWQVLRGSQVVEELPHSAAEFTWTPPKPGTYTIQLQLNMRSDRDTTLERTMAVIPKPRVEPTPAVVEERREKRRPDPELPKPTPVVPKPDIAPKKVGECFAKADPSMGPASIVKVDLPVPKRGEVTWRSTGTVFEVVPKRDCQLSGFEWWGNNNTGNGDATISIECLEPNCDAKKKVRTTRFQITAGYDEPEKRTYSNLPILKANYRYRIRIGPEQGAPMGHFPLPRTTYEQVGVVLYFNQPESGVFNITFRVK